MFQYHRDLLLVFWQFAIKVLPCSENIELSQTRPARCCMRSVEFLHSLSIEKLHSLKDRIIRTHEGIAQCKKIEKNKAGRKKSSGIITQTAIHPSERLVS